MSMTVDLLIVESII